MNWKTNSLKAPSVFVFSSLLFLFFTFFLLANQSALYIAFSVLFCFLVIGYFLSLSSLKYGYYFLAIVLPFSIKQGIGSSGFDIVFPSEALIAILAIALVFKWMVKGFENKFFLQHPVTILIFIYLILSGISTASSSMPLVSLKAFVVRITYVLVFYFGVYDVFKNQSKAAIQLFLNYGYSLFFITLYCLYFQSQHNWGKQSAALSVNPFYSDHTIYSACTVFVLPAFLIHFSFSKNRNANLLSVAFGWICITAFLLGIYFTFCRAAWISIFICFLFFISIKLKFKTSTYFFLLLATLVFVGTNKEELIYSFKENKNVSTAPNTTALEQTQSITNLSTDASNAERLNRWSCAWRMFLDKPLLGFGPGTFQFQYLSYQLPDETTYISVFSPYNILQGRGGSTHNEYLLLLSESGIFCLIAFLFLLIVAIATAVKIIYQTKQKHIQQSMLWILLGLFTYLMHGFFNNFLDTDKAAFLFWIALAMMVNLILEHKKTVSNN